MQNAVFIVCFASFGLVFSQLISLPTIPSPIDIGTDILNTITCKAPDPIGNLYHYVNGTKTLLEDGSPLNVSLPTYFVTHGWLTDSDENVIMAIAQALYEEVPCNVVMVDYRKLASLYYNCAPGMVNKVGAFVANFIIRAYKEYNLLPTNIFMVGHSLGSHASGVCGKEVFAALNKKIRRISALDPAGPLFAIPLRLLPGESLQVTDASFVDALHTTLLTGTIEPMGHVDTFANGLIASTVQWPCVRTPYFSCSHGISKAYYLESIKSCGLRATNIKNSNDVVPYGYHMPETTRGIFTFTPNSEEPYGKGNKTCP